MIQEPSVQITEILGILGFDYILFDCEHSAMGFETIANLVMAAEFRGITPLVRLPKNEPDLILHFLDTGALGIVVPDLNSVEEAQKAVRGAKYPPQGERGLAPVRVADYGLKYPLGDYPLIGNEQTMVIGIVESREGIKNIDGILSVEGIDAMFIGTIDLSLSLGVPGKTNHPLVLEAVETVISAGKKFNKPIGCSVRANENPAQYVEKGFRIIGTIVNTIFSTACSHFLEMSGTRS